ncbi:MAG: YihY/virulence factor BrkB family protein [Anaerolineales bacterium]|jgi:membrane protein
MKSTYFNSLDRIKHRLGQFYKDFNRLTWGVPNTFRKAFQSFSQAHAAEAAASMAYYAFFSLFPLLLVLSSILGFFLYSGNNWLSIVNYVTRFIPIQAHFIQQNLLEILRARNTVGVIGLVGLIWSASGAFSALAVNINRAWEISDTRSFITDRLLAVAMVAAISLMLIIIMVASSLMALLPSFNIPLLGSFSIYYTFVWQALVRIVPLVIACLVFYLMYKLLPSDYVKPSAALSGALVAGIVWEAATSAFTWYLGSGLANYQAVYGSLGTIVGFLTWIYFSAWITLFGAHLSAVVSHHSGNKVEASRPRLQSIQRGENAAG